MPQFCGSFLAARNRTDLLQVHRPDRYTSKWVGVCAVYGPARMLIVLARAPRQSFYKFYKSEIRPKMPAIVIGGSHEASNYLFEMS